MKSLTWWYRVTGVVYVLLGLSWLPVVTMATVSQKIPDFDGAPGGTAVTGFADWMLVFSLDLLVLGAFLLVGSRRPMAWLPLLWLTIALGVVRGIADDVYMIARGYPPLPFLGFIILHAAIIAWGVLAWRGVRRQTGARLSPR
ncbi:hypothetical protein E5344_04840 [Microbacterium laevaniformans]|uniref:BphX family protein n=1 Tax=Microbacterium laevaniformans TaxID=36807 RepID=A0A4S2D9T9_9MICO|nr:BphX family protein [Microbacterium laevaniformans]TGY38558.1 hypothetical protein E5344_04840 [Microbacterium laevaniformans]